MPCPRNLLQAAALATALASACLLFPLPAAAQEAHPDTTSAPLLRIAPGPVDHSPRGALWRAAALPGWGQIYNRQHYKLPVVYGGLAGLAYAVLRTNGNYLLYRHAYLYAAYRPDDETGQRRYQQYRGDYYELLDRIGVPAAQGEDRASELAPRLRENRDILRRNRDLLYIGVGLFYGLTILDAYVNAHLLDFDVSEDLSVRVFPIPGGVGAVLHARR